MVAALLLATAGCGSPDRDLGWEVVFGTGTDPLRAARVEARILGGGCDGTTELYATAVIPGEAMGPRPGVLPPGVYGFDAVAVDDACVVYALACQERTLPLAPGETVTLTLVDTLRPSRRCEASRCTSGVCEDLLVDAGSDAATVDAMFDSSTDATTGGFCTAEDLVDQTLCGPGLQCVYSGTETTPDYVCYTAGAAGDNAECLDVIDCARGLTCTATSSDGSTPSICLRWCRTDADCPVAEGTFCAPTTLDAGVCSTGCNPTRTDVCPAGTKCDIYDEMGHTYCGPAGTRSEGQTCTAYGDCLPGLTCTGDTSTLTCLAYCDIRASGCSSATDCVPYDPSNFGVCL